MDSLGPIILIFLLAGIGVFLLMTLIAWKYKSKRTHMAIAAVATMVVSVIFVVINNHGQTLTSIILNSLILCSIFGILFLVVALIVGEFINKPAHEKQ